MYKFHCFQDHYLPLQIWINLDCLISKFLPVFLHEKDFNKFRMPIFGHSEFIPVFFGKIVRKNLEQPFLAILNLYQSFWEKNCQKKFRMAISGHSKFVPVFLGKIVRKQFGTAIFGHSEFIPVFLGKIVGKYLKWPFLTIPNLYQSFWEKLSENIQNSHFWPFQIYTSLFGINCWKKFRMAIFGHSEFFLTIFLYISL